MNRLPYFRWHPSDAETDEFYCRLTLPELGLYHRCLNLAWINGSLPCQPDDIAMLLRYYDMQEFNELWETVQQAFCPDPDHPGRLVNPRQEEERNWAIEKSAKAANSARGISSVSAASNTKQAKKTLKANAERTLSERSTKPQANVSLRAYESASDSDSDSDSEKKKKETENDVNFKELLVSEDGFEEFRSEHRRVTAAEWTPTDWKMAHSAWKVLDFEQRAAALAGIRARDGLNDFGVCRAKPVKYLTEALWLRSLPREPPQQKPKQLSTYERIQRLREREAKEEHDRRNGQQAG